MTTWALVLILYTGFNYQMTNVPGFATEAVCVSEGKKWEERRRSTHTYHCVEVQGNSKN